MIEDASSGNVGGPSNEVNAFGQSIGGTGGSIARKRFRVDLVAEFMEHDAEVWRVEWNITGTILSSSGDDGKVRLWKGRLLNANILVLIYC
jgi:WD40 repeat protein